jgi:hypothetical protein
MPQQIFYLLHWKDQFNNLCTNELYETLNLAVEKGIEKYNIFIGSSDSITNNQITEFKNSLVYPINVKNDIGFGYFEIYILPLQVELPLNFNKKHLDNYDDSSSSDE